MMDMYGPIFRHVLLPLWEQGIRRRPTLEYLGKLRQTQWAPLHELETLQSNALRKLVEHAYSNVPYYSRCFTESGVRPETVRDVRDITRLPVLTRDDAVQSFRTRTATRGATLDILKMTSGSSGVPLEFGYDDDSECWRRAVKLRGYEWAGCRPGDESLHFWGLVGGDDQKHSLKQLKVALDRRMRREYFIDSNHRSEADLARVVSVIRSRRPKALVCYAQGAAALARFVNDTKARVWDDIPVLCAAERLFSSDRRAIERAFGPAFETYGNREVMLIGSECEAHDGMHLSAENLIVEVLVRDAGSWRPAAPGESGEIAITDLHNYAQPFIRYLNGDIGRFAHAGTCRCGRTLPRLLQVEGRTCETLYDANGQAVSGLFLNVLFTTFADKVRAFQAIQRKNGRLDLKIVRTPKFDGTTQAKVQKTCREVLRGLEPKIEFVDSIPLGKNGKLRVVSVER